MSATLRIDDFVNNSWIFETPPPIINIESKRFPVFTYYNKDIPDDYCSDAI